VYIETFDIYSAHARYISITACYVLCAKGRSTWYGQVSLKHDGTDGTAKMVSLCNGQMGQADGTAS